MIEPFSFQLNGATARCVVVPVVGDFEPPEYFFGQCLWHCVELPTGKFLYPVVVFGMSWTGSFWQYAIELPEYHVRFRENDSKFDWVDSDELQPM